MHDPPFDPRAVANLMLDEADRFGIRITNLALQKLLYFAHGIFLVETKKPFVSGYFEAWQYGPVHPSAYRAFKSAGSDPIEFRAMCQDLVTGQLTDLPELNSPVVRRHAIHVLTSYGPLSPGRLVDIAHAKGSPWHYIANKGRTSVAFGLRIPDNVIAERFKYHKVCVGVEPKAGEPREDTPLT